MNMNKINLSLLNIHDINSHMNLIIITKIDDFNHFDSLIKYLFMYILTLFSIYNYDLCGIILKQLKDIKIRSTSRIRDILINLSFSIIEFGLVCCTYNLILSL